MLNAKYDKIISTLLLSLSLLFLMSACEEFEAATSNFESTEDQILSPEPPPPPRAQPPLEIPTGSQITKNIIVAYGNADSTIISCDGGLSWTGAQSSPDAPPYNPQDPNAGIGHTNFRAGDLEYSAGKFYYIQGWFGDKRTKVSVSEDGMNWSYLTPLDAPIYDGWSFAVTPTSVVTGDHYWHYFPLDSGAEEWIRSAEIAPVVKQRHNFLHYYQGATLEQDTIISVDDWGNVPDERKFAFSEDDGRSFQKAEGPEGAECGGHDVAQIPGGILLTGAYDLCYSTNGGRNWSLVTDFPDSLITNIIWNGEKFLLYRGYANPRQSTIYESTDGLNWSMHTESTFQIHGDYTRRGTVLHYDPIDDVYVGYNAGEFIRSEDGVIFETVEVLNRAEHPPLFMKSGLANISPGHPCYD